MAAELNQQVWISQLMENFYPDSSFLAYAKDYTGFVNNNKLNLAEAGLDPTVLVNNTTYPIPVSERLDIPHEVPLDQFETENTIVRRPTAIEYAYDQLESVLMGHRNALKAKTGMWAAYAYAPASNTVDTPVLVTTGDNDGTGRLRLLPEDIIRLKTEYDNVDYPLDKRYLVLNPLHVADLMKYDLSIFKDIVDIKNGEPQRFASFNMMQFSRTPTYTTATKLKKAFGSSFNASTDSVSSFAFYADEIAKADGDVFMYAALNDPKERATIVGFDKRFIAMPIRNKGIGSIISGKAA
jgi:hypothetical protein